MCEFASSATAVRLMFSSDEICELRFWSSLDNEDIARL